MKIANKIVYFFVAAITIIVFIVSFISYAIMSNSLKKQIYAHLSTVAQSRAHHIMTYLKEEKHKLHMMTESNLFELALKMDARNGQVTEQTADKVNSQLLKFLKTDEETYEIFILNQDGKIVFSTDKKNVNLDKSADAYFLEGKNKFYIKDVYYSETTKEKGYSVSGPIRDDVTGEFMGVLVSRFGMKCLNEIIADTTGLGQTGEIYIVNKHGYMITLSRFRKDTFLKQKVDTINVRKCFSMKGNPEEHASHEVVGVFPNYRGVKVLGTHYYIKEMDWGLMAEIDAKEALSPLNLARTIIIFIILLVPLTAWAIGSLISRIISGPIQRLHKGTEIIGKGNLDYKVGTSANDEIGQLSRAFDTMTESLKTSTTSIGNLNKEITERKKAEEALHISEEKFRVLYNNSPDMYVSVSSDDASILLCNETLLKKTGYSREEIIGSPIFTIYHDDCMGRAKEAFQQFVETGVIQDKELILKRKDGSKIDVSLNVNAVRDETGKILHSISSWRDITERKETEKALKESEDKYKSLFQNLNSGYAYCQMIFDKKGTPTDFKYLEVNSNFEKLTGLKDVVGKRVTEVIPTIKKETPEILDICGKVASTGKGTSFEINFTPLKKWLSISAYCPKKDFFVAVFEDITERKEIEETLKNEKEDLEKFTDIAVGRELKMAVMEKEIKRLKRGNGEEESM